MCRGRWSGALCTGLRTLREAWRRCVSAFCILAMAPVRACRLLLPAQQGRVHLVRSHVTQRPARIAPARIDLITATC